MKPAGFSERERQNICWWKWGSPLSIKYMKSKHGTAGSKNSVDVLQRKVSILLHVFKCGGKLNPFPEIYKYRPKVTHPLPISLIREVGDSTNR
jgi:hypothetical protein